MVTDATVLSLAQQGDADAIAFLINQALAKKDIAATATLEDKCLQVTLTSNRVPPQDGCVYVVFEGMRLLGTASINSIEIIGQQCHQPQPAWSQTLELIPPASDIPKLTSQPQKPTTPSPNASKAEQKKLKTRLSLLWLKATIFLLVAALGATLAAQFNGTITSNKKSTLLQPSASILPKQPLPASRPSPIAKRAKPSPKVKSSPRPTKMKLKATIAGKISPKSVVHSGQGLFFAQNMMYRHTITVYNRQHKLVKTIPDRVNLAKYGYGKFKGNYQGAPVEASFSHNGKYAWISNYQMYGRGFNNPGSDRCSPSQGNDESFLYRINTKTWQIEKVIQVGSVPKYVATSPAHSLVLVSNWCSWDLSVVDVQKNREIKRIKLGRYPRGIVVNSAAKTAYVAVMGSQDIAQVDLEKFSVKWLRNIGRSPRHLNLDPQGKYLYASLNGEGRIAKISLPKGQVVAKVATGNTPRSMVLSQDGQRLYVVNYNENTVSKVRTQDMKVLQKVNVAASPIGITYDPQTRQVWVACYSGSIMIFQD